MTKRSVLMLAVTVVLLPAQAMGFCLQDNLGNSYAFEIVGAAGAFFSLVGEGIHGGNAATACGVVESAPAVGAAHLQGGNIHLALSVHGTPSCFPFSIAVTLSGASLTGSGKLDFPSNGSSTAITASLVPACPPLPN